MNNYPEVKFKCFLTQTYQFQNQGYIIGEWLHIGWTNNLLRSISIFNCYGYKIAPIEFATWNDAILFAEFINEHYQDFFVLWTENPQYNIPELTQHTVDNGNAILFAIKHFSNQIISFSEFVDEYTRLSS